VHCYDWKNSRVYYRPGYGDIGLIDELLLKSDRSPYRIPPFIRPNCIVDFGANIGIATIFFANNFPAAKVFSFEPEPSNFALLSRNAAQYPNVNIFQLAIGNENSVLSLKHPLEPYNYGSFSLYDLRVDENNAAPVVCRHAGELLAELRIETIDVIKVDTEGAEYDILTSIPIDILASVKVIVGELHGIKQAELLNYLSKYFEIEVDSKNTFRALNRIFSSGEGVQL
jgi:FkbM family methyltransferase